MEHQVSLAQLQSIFGPCVFLKWPRGLKGSPRKWKHLSLDDMTPEYLADILDGNIGIGLGQVSNGLCAIDLDDDALVQPFMEANPWTANTTITKGARGCQIWMRIIGEYPPSATLKRDGKACGEWRADGNQSIVPPSIHPDTGKQYSFITMLPVAELSYIDINFIYLLPPCTDIAQIGTDNTDSTDTTLYICPPNPSLFVPVCNDKALLGSVAEFQYSNLVIPFIPTAKGSNHRLLFGLARRITLLEASGVTLDASQAFDAWFDASKTMTRQNKTVDEYLIEFLEALKCVQDDDLSQAWKESASFNPPGAGNLADPNNRRLAALCCLLGQRSQNGVFYLSCRSVAFLFGIDHTDGARRLKMLTKPMVALLQIVTAGSPKSGKATRYRYIGKTESL